MVLFLIARTTYWKQVKTYDMYTFTSRGGECHDRKRQFKLERCDRFKLIFRLFTVLKRILSERYILSSISFLPFGRLLLVFVANGQCNFLTLAEWNLQWDRVCDGVTSDFFFHSICEKISTNEEQMWKTVHMSKVKGLDTFCFMIRLEYSWDKQLDTKMATWFVLNCFILLFSWTGSISDAMHGVISFVNY